MTGEGDYNNNDIIFFKVIKFTTGGSTVSGSLSPYTTLAAFLSVAETGNRFAPATPPVPWPALPLNPLQPEQQQLLGFWARRATVANKRHRKATSTMARHVIHTHREPALGRVQKSGPRTDRENNSGFESSSRVIFQAWETLVKG